MSRLPSLAFSLLWLVLDLALPAARASEGTPRPPCGQTLWVGGAAVEAVVHPGAGQPIDVPLRIVPYVDWNPDLGACSMPVNAVLSVQLKCNPADGSESIFVGPTLVPVGVPATPGVQDLLTGAGSTPEFGGPFDFPIGADVLSPETSWRCTVSLTYSVTFSGGVGNDVLTALRQTVVSIVPPAPTDATRPRLELRRLDAGEEGLVARRRGDVAAHRYAVLNNDADHGVDLTFSARSYQVARQPSGVNSDETIYSVASPEIDRDAFPLRFADLLDQGDLPPEGDPTKAAETRIERTLHLGPGDVAIVTVLARSHGAASDGTCAGLTADVEGWFEDGTPTRAAVSALQRVADVPAGTPHHEATDTLSVGSSVDATWSPATFDDVAARRTHGPGNRIDGSGTRTAGTALGANAEYPETAVDTLRTEAPVDRCEYTVIAQDAGDDPQRNEVVITNLATAGMPLDIRVFAENGGEGDLKLVLDAETGHARLIDRTIKKKKKQTVYDGSWSILVATPPNGYLTLPDTQRSFTFDDPEGTPAVSTLPDAFARTFPPAATPDDVFLYVNDPRTFATPLAWGATSDGPAVTPNAASGTDAEVPSVALAVGSMAAFPDVTVTNVSITSAGAAGSPLVVPFVTRTLAGKADPDPLEVTSFSGAVSFVKDGKDKLVLKGTVPIDEGFQPKGETVVFALDSLHVAFTLDKKGKAKTGKHTFQLSLKKKKKGVVQAGDRPFTLRLKKAELSGILSRHFVRADGPENTLIASTMPVTSWWFSGAQTRSAPVTLSSYVTPKKGTFTGVVVE